MLFVIYLACFNLLAAILQQFIFSKLTIRFYFPDPWYRYVTIMKKKASLYLTYTCYPGDFIFSTAHTFHCPLAKKDVHIFPNDETLDEMYIYMNKSLKRLNAENVLKCWKNNYV